MQYSMYDLWITRDGREYRVSVDYDYEHGDDDSTDCPGYGDCVGDWRVYLYDIDITDMITAVESDDLIEQIYRRHY